MESILEAIRAEQLNVPKHVAIILDGNGRWAKKRNMPRNYGHVQGSKTVEQIIEDGYNMGIEYITVYAFSTENWKRSKEEQARERKRQNDIKKTETRIEELEQLLSSLEEEMSLPENATNVAKLTEITTRQAAATEELEALYETWESLSEA